MLIVLSMMYLQQIWFDVKKYKLCDAQRKQKVYTRDLFTNLFCHILDSFDFTVMHSFFTKKAANSRAKAKTTESVHK